MAESQRGCCGQHRTRALAERKNTSAMGEKNLKHIKSKEHSKHSMHSKHGKGKLEVKSLNDRGV
jgi:hypothetical protein